jgi:hypothetical protein
MTPEESKQALSHLDAAQESIDKAISLILHGIDQVRLALKIMKEVEKRFNETSNPSLSH